MVLHSVFYFKLLLVYALYMCYRMSNVAGDNFANGV